MVKAFLRGHPIIYIHEIWLYEDTKTPTDGNERPCGRCDYPQTDEGHDGCLGTLPGIMNACCGHGQIKEAYVQFLDGSSIHGQSANIILHELKKSAAN